MIEEGHAGAAGSPSLSANLDMYVGAELHQVAMTKVQEFEAEVKPRSEELKVE